MNSLDRSILRLLLLCSAVLPLALLSQDIAEADSPITLQYDFAAPEIVQTGKYHSVTIEGLANLDQAGDPRLPIKAARVLVPYGQQVSDIKVICDTQITLEGSYVIEPGQEPLPLSYKGQVLPTLPSPAIYDSSKPFPGVLHSASSIQTKKGYQILALTLYPVQYVPQEGSLSYCASMTLQVSTKPASTKLDEMLRYQPQQWAADKEEIQAIVDNPGATKGYPSSPPPSSPPLGGIVAPLLDPDTSYDYVIITNENLMNAPVQHNFQALAAAKEARGISTVIATTEWISATYSGLRPDGGHDLQTKIRNFILDAYQTWGTEYILLGGDGDGGDVGGESGDGIIPHRGFASVSVEIDDDIPADMYYACLDGTFDHDEDGKYGEPNDGPDGGEVDLYAEVYVGRAAVDSAEELANFVRKTLAYEDEDTAYLRNVWMVGEDLGWSAPWGGDRKDDIKEGSSAAGYTTVGFEDSPCAAFFDTQTLYDRDYAGNDWPKSAIIDVINSPAHLINHMGHASVTYVMKMHNADVDNSLTNEHYFIGYSQGCYDGAFDNRDAPLPYGSGGYLTSDSISEHLTNGNHGAVAFIGNSRYGWGNGLNPHLGASQYYDRQFWDAVLGENILNIGHANQDSKEDTYGVVGQGGFTWVMRWVYYELNLFGDPELVIKTGTGIIYQSHTVDDDNSGGSSGNNNGRVEAGETIEMPVTLFNSSQTKVTTVTASLSTASTYITITNALASYGDIAARGSGTSTAPYVFSVNLTCPDDHQITFTLDISGTIDGTETVETWSDTFRVEAHSEPQIGVAPTSFDETLDWGETITRTLLISNAGPGALEFELFEIEGDFTPTGLSLGSGGPDDFGYTYQDSNEPGGPEFDFVDISATGTSVSLGDDGYAGPYAVGFDFPFYGTDQTQFYISSNGFLSFGSGSSDWGNDCPLPSTNAPHNLIGLMWDDMDPGDTGDQVYYRTFPSCPYSDGACLVVQYENYHHYPGGGAIAGTFEAILFENGNVLIQFEDAGAEEGSGSTTGIENGSGTDGLTYGSCNTAGSLQDSLAVCFQYPGAPPCAAVDVPWLSEEPITGTVPAHSATPVTITLDGSQVDEPGIYWAGLRVHSNDPDSPTVNASVTMTVIPRCDPISEVQISRTPAGDLFTGNSVRFTADADGTTPFTHTWTLNGTSVGANRSTFEHTFDTAGTYTVGVTVTNDCAQGSDTMVVEVLQPASEQPDLSGSYKSVNLTSVENGDTLTYTLFLRNSSAVAAAVILTDPIPMHTTYIPGSAQAGDTTPVTLINGQLHWSGQVISGTPVVLQFAVEVQAAPVGTPITNVAHLDDGLGHVVLLETRSTYNPGYGLTVNEGALYTNVQTVTLRFSWNADDDITHVKISNDGGFGPAGDTTGWIPVNPETPTYADWVLATYGDLRMPRTVYAKFRDKSGGQYGPIQDDIIYDPDPPQVTRVEIITQTVQTTGAMEGQDVIVRVTTSDNNSGVSKVQISHSADFEQFSEFAVTGTITDIPWTLQPSGEVYVRVVDRAGNLSQVSSGQTSIRFKIHLPLLIRSLLAAP